MRPAEFLSWNLNYGLDNPILSTGRSPTGSLILRIPAAPLASPVVNDSGADLLTSLRSHHLCRRCIATVCDAAGQLQLEFLQWPRLWSASGAHQLSDGDDCFCWLHTPQPSNSLGDYRTGNSPAGSVAPPF